MADETKTDVQTKHEAECALCRKLTQDGKPWKPTDDDPLCRVCKTPKHAHAFGVLCK